MAIALKTIKTDKRGLVRPLFALMPDRYPSRIFSFIIKSQEALN